MRFIGITGGIGAGKSKILGYIKQHYRCEIYLADEVAHLLKQPGTECYQALLALLGPDAAGADGQIDRQVMADRIFAAPRLLEQVNEIIHPAVKAFLTESAAFGYAAKFTNILLTTSILFGLFYVLCNSLQAMGAATPALIVNLSRQGIIYIPALFILQAWLGVSGLVWAQPVADILSTALVLFHYFRVSRKMIAGHR